MQDTQHISKEGRIGGHISVVRAPHTRRKHWGEYFFIEDLAWNMGQASCSFLLDPAKCSV